MEVLIMINPWEHLPKEPPFVLESDKSLVENFNKELSNKKTKIHLELLPDPYLGNPQAKVVLLGLNPGFDESETEFHVENNYLMRTGMENLVHKITDYPFYLLNPNNSATKGYQYWNGKRGKLKQLIKEFGIDIVAKQIFCIEFFPYHSIEYDIRLPILNSQKYNFYLVRQAIKNNAVIVIMRNEKNWLKYVPELKNYSCCYKLKNYRTPWITRGNITSWGYDVICKSLSELKDMKAFR